MIDDQYISEKIKAVFDWITSKREVKEGPSLLSVFDKAKRVNEGCVTIKQCQTARTYNQLFAQRYGHKNTWDYRHALDVIIARRRKVAYDTLIHGYEESITKKKTEKV